MGTIRATRSMLSSRFILPTSPTALALAKPSMTTALTPSLEKTRLATRPATPPQKSTTMVAPEVFSVHGALQALYELLDDAARVDQLPYVAAVGSTVLLAHEGLLHGPLIALRYGGRVGGEKRISTSSGSLPARTCAPAEDLPASTSWRTTPAWAALRSLMLIPVPSSAAVIARFATWAEREESPQSYDGPRVERGAEG